jgi:hypothetical protein
MVSKKIINIAELLTLAISIEDKDLKEKIERTYTLFYNNIKKKYITKAMKNELEDIGFIEKSMYCYKIADKIYENKSGEIDVIEKDGEKILRVGIGRKLQYNPVWFELRLY